MAQIPNVQIPGYITQTALAAVQAAIDDAARLGLTWRLRPGTVGGSGVANPVRVPVVVDGDDATTKASSMVGALAAGQRVWCAQIPPAGLYVIGIIGTSVAVPSTQSFTSSGTWTRPTGLAYVDVWVAAGGGGSGGAPATGAGQSSMGGGGGGGATARARIPAALLPATVPVTVGPGGGGGAATAGVTGGTGGMSLFGSLLSASGGLGGTARAASAVPHGIDGGAGSSTIGGTIAGILHSGSAGAPGWGSDNGLGTSGTGGASHFGGGGAARRTTAAGQGLAGNTGRLYGGGASGSLNAPSTAGRSGATGAAGIVIVEEYYQ